MKNVLMLLSLWVVLPLAAQRPNHIQTRQTEPSAPTVLYSESEAFLLEFQNVVKFLADKNNSFKDREDRAKWFAARFGADAKIEVLNGKKKLSLTPIDYFYRVINLNYDQVTIDFTLSKDKGVTKSNVANRWTAQYEVAQVFHGTRNGKLVYADWTLRVVNMWFVWSPPNNWTRQMGTIEAVSNVRLPTPK